MLDCKGNTLAPGNSNRWWLWNHTTSVCEVCQMKNGHIIQRFFQHSKCGPCFLCEEHLITFNIWREHWLPTGRFNLFILTDFFHQTLYNLSNHRIGCLPDKSINKWQRISFNEFQDNQLSTWCAQTNLNFTKAPTKSWKLPTSFALSSHYFLLEV